MNCIDNFPNDEKTMILNAYNVITRLEKWEFLKTYKPPENMGFMWDPNPVIDNIKDEINNSYCGHSGASIAYVLRIMVWFANNKDSNIS